MSFNGTLTNSNTANSSLEAKQKIEYVDIISNMLVEIQNEIYEKQNFLGPKSHSCKNNYSYFSWNHSLFDYVFALPPALLHQPSHSNSRLY